jgi:hypothetical protein
MACSLLLKVEWPLLLLLLLLRLAGTLLAALVVALVSAPSRSLRLPDWESARVNITAFAHLLSFLRDLQAHETELVW